MEAIVWAGTVTEHRLSGRTRRSFEACGHRVQVTNDPTLLVGPQLIAQPGAWLKEHLPIDLPSSPGLLALGSDDGKEWLRLMRKCGGDFSRLGRFSARRHFPFIPVCYLQEAERLQPLLKGGKSLQEAVCALAFSGSCRVVRWSALDASFSSQMRVLQVVTSIQTGGAERITLDFAEELNHQGIATAVLALGAATRTEFPAPPHFASLAAVPQSGRAAAVLSNALEWGADLVHAHLIKAPLARELKQSGLPLVITIHNSKPGWPDGMESCTAECADLLLACSNHVADELPKIPGLPIRTVWNGILPTAFIPTGETQERAIGWRRKHGIPQGAKVLLCLANPRPQKRMDRLPAILKCLSGVHLVIAGEASFGSDEVVAPLKAEFEMLGLSKMIHWVGTSLEVSTVLAACDVLLSTSDWEGLSLAHLEALAAGKPVVATDVGGTREIASRHPALLLLPKESTPQEFATALTQALDLGNKHPFPPCFTRHVMVERAARLYARVLAPKKPVRQTLWLVANNFSIGGAQTSARRLLVSLAAKGLDVRAAVIQENPKQPTPGRQALMAAGIPIVSIPPPETCDAARACELLLEQMDAAPPGVVVFWNVITAYKVILADGLFHCRVFDVSPGEMFHSSLEKYFTSPRADFPYTSPVGYGSNLSGVVAKYRAAAGTAESVLGAPVTVIPNGVPLPTLPKHPRKSDAPLIFATMARLSPDKCLGQLIEAMRLASPRLPTWELRVAGGRERDHWHHARELRRMAKGLPVDWCGEVEDTQAFLTDSDVFLMISEPPGCPNASLEALASGLPVVATDVGGASEQVINGQTGLLVPAGDPAALASAIVRIASDPELRCRLGKAGREHVAVHFSMDTMMERYRNLFFG